MQPLMVFSTRILAHADGEDRSVRPLRTIDHRRRSDPYLGGDLRTSENVASCLARSKDRSLPDLDAAVGIEGINTAMFGGDIKYVVQLAAYSHVGKIKRLGIHLSIGGVEADLAELG